MFSAHRKSGAEITMLYTKSPDMIRPEYGTYLSIDESGFVNDIEIDPTKAQYKNTSMEVMIMRKDLLLELVDRGAAHGYHDLTRDMIQRLIRDAGMKVAGYEYKDVCFRMDSVQRYFQFNMDMLNSEIRHALFYIANDSRSFMSCEGI